MKRLADFVTLSLLAALVACSGGDARLPPDQRPLASEQPAELREAYRKLPFEGAHNFRDLGGYETRDGKRVKWGVVYRSDKLADLTDDDLVFMKRLGLKQNVDFRSEFEKQEEPDRFPASAGITYVERPVDVEGTAVKEIVERIQTGDVEGLDLENLLVVANRAFVTDSLAPFRDHIHNLLDPNKLPSLVHCTAGKDRTGFAAALTLLVLGVPRETVVRDYLLTNTYTEKRINKIEWLIRFESLFRTDPEEIRPLLGVKQRYIEAAFEAMESEYGSIDNFIRDGLGIDAAMREQLRSNLLEG